MTIAAALRELLLTMPPVTALVSTRIHVLMLPQSPLLPAIRIQRIDELEGLHLRGRIDLKRARVQIDSIASGGAVAETIDEAVHGDGISTGLNCYRGTVGVVQIALVQPVDVRTVYDAAELRQYKVARDYYAWYREV